ncbi:MAG TPA: hypothetical protein VFE24_01510 [Pirellulales bacterium]|jgi:hypothetical protein|nr:hypothetical protein [Pirellulales bacterium]
MKRSEKLSWSAAAGMTFVAAVFAGMLWGRSQTVPAATAAPWRQLLESSGQPSVSGLDPSPQQAAAEIAEARDRLGLRLFQDGRWQQFDLAPADSQVPATSAAQP